jgi:hypothetical protein
MQSSPRDRRRSSSVTCVPSHTLNTCALTNTTSTVSAYATAKQLPPPGWTPPSQAVDSVFTPTGRDLGNSSISSLWQTLSSTHESTDLGAIHQIGAPIHVYPLYENAFRAHRGQSLRANHEESARLYAEFSKVAEGIEYAWSRGKSDGEDVIGKVGGKNRMICYPCEYFIRTDAEV